MSVNSSSLEKQYQQEKEKSPNLKEEKKNKQQLKQQVTIAENEKLTKEVSNRTAEKKEVLKNLSTILP